MDHDLIDEVAEAYLTRGASGEHVSIRSLAKEYGTTVLRIRKMLITAGVYRSELSDRVNLLYEEGMTIEQIQKETGLGRASVHSYLPYTKSVYNMEEVSDETERIRRYRRRRELKERLQAAGEVRRLEGMRMADNEIGNGRRGAGTELWMFLLRETVKAYEGYGFADAQENVRIRYEIEGDVLRRKDTEERIGWAEFVRMAEEMVCDEGAGRMAEEMVCDGEQGRLAEETVCDGERERLPEEMMSNEEHEQMTEEVTEGTAGMERHDKTPEEGTGERAWVRCVLEELLLR